MRRERIEGSFAGESAARPPGWHEGLGRIVHPDKSLILVRGEAEEFAALAELEEWDDLYEDERIDFSMEWSEAMSHLRTLEELRSANHLADALAREYAPVRRRVAELLPTIKRLGLEPPPEIFGDE